MWPIHAWFIDAEAFWRLPDPDHPFSGVDGAQACTASNPPAVGAAAWAMDESRASAAEAPTWSEHALVRLGDALVAIGLVVAIWLVVLCLPTWG